MEEINNTPHSPMSDILYKFKTFFRRPTSLDNFLGGWVMGLFWNDPFGILMFYHRWRYEALNHANLCTRILLFYPESTFTHKDNELGKQISLFPPPPHPSSLKST